MSQEATLVIPEAETPEFVPVNMDDDSSWYQNLRIQPTQVDCAYVNPAFANAKCPPWNMPEEVKRTWHLNHTMPEFWTGRWEGLFKGAAHGTAANPIVVE